MHFLLRIRGNVSVFKWLVIARRTRIRARPRGRIGGQGMLLEGQLITMRNRVRVVLEVGLAGRDEVERRGRELLVKVLDLLGEQLEPVEDLGVDAGLLVVDVQLLDLVVPEHAQHVLVTPTTFGRSFLLLRRFT